MKKIKLFLMTVAVAGLTYAGVDYSCTVLELFPFGNEWNKMHNNTSYSHPEKADHRMALYFQEFVKDVAVEAVKKKKANIPENISMNRIFEIAWEALRDDVYKNRDGRPNSATKIIIEALEKKFPKK